MERKFEDSDLSSDESDDVFALPEDSITLKQRGDLIRNPFDIRRVPETPSVSPSSKEGKEDCYPHRIYPKFAWGDESAKSRGVRLESKATAKRVQSNSSSTDNLDTGLSEEEKSLDDFRPKSTK